MTDNQVAVQQSHLNPAKSSIGQAATVSLCSLLAPEKLSEIEGMFAQLAGLQLTLFDALGSVQPDGSESVQVDDKYDAGDAAVECASSASLFPPLAESLDDHGRRQYVGPIYADGRLLGTVRIGFRDDYDPTETVAMDAEAGASLLYQCVSVLARSCVNEHQLQQRVDELSALFELSTLLAGHHDVQQVLDAAARSGALVMKVKAASIRLLSETTQEMVPKAVYNLSEAYLGKGPVLLEHSELARQALAGEVVYVRDMATDPRVLYPEDARREGLVSILSTGMIYRDKPVGVIRLYTGFERKFSPFEVSLLKAIAQIMAASITNARLHAETDEAQQAQKQLELAAKVQRRMLPGAMPHLPPFDIAAQYVPSFELGGDFFDFIHLDGHVGVALGDVVGKGVAASLLMASVRASLRAYAQDVYDIDEVVSRVNVALSRDTLDNEFATLFYGVLDPPTRRLTYCNAGHDPPLLLRGGKFIRLTVGGMIVGVDTEQRYDKAIVDFQRDDMLLIYSDGLSDAMNFDGQTFGKQRIMNAMKQAVDLPAAAAVKHVLWQMRCFTGLQRLNDDTTIVLIKTGK